MHKLGLVSVSFRGLTPAEAAEAAKNAGLSCIEWGSDVHAPCRDLERLKEIVKIQQDTGLTCCSYGTYFRIGVNPAEELTDYIRAAKILGTDILRLWCGDKGSDAYETDAQREAFYEECRTLAKIAEREQVILCMECHNNTMTDRKEAALALMQAVDSPAFRMYYQPNQFRTREENLAYAALLAPYTYHLHVFNWEGHERYPLAESVELWKKYLSCFEADHCLLLEFMPDDRVETLPAEADALRAIVGG